jgi:hypothetical protein
MDILQFNFDFKMIQSKTISKELERIRLKYINRIIETRAKVDFGQSFEIFGKVIGPFTTGNHYKMEFWIAKIFIKNDILEFVEGEQLNLQNIQKIAFTEGRSKDINKIDSFLFTAIREYMDILVGRLKLNFATPKQFREIYSNVQDLMVVRHRKILSLSQTQMSMSMKNTQNLTEEEKVLMSSLTDDIDDWKRFFLIDAKDMEFKKDKK